MVAQRTVNPSPSGIVGSNPSTPTINKISPTFVCFGGLITRENIPTSAVEDVAWFSVVKLLTWNHNSIG